MKHLPKLRTANDDIRKRLLYVAIDRCPRFVHLAVYDAENATNAISFLKATRKAFPFRITHMLTDPRPALPPTISNVARATQGQSPHDAAYAPQTSGMVERFNGRVASEVLGINLDISKSC